MAWIPRTWHCGNGHTFKFGNENWHFEINQGVLEDNNPIPMYCLKDDEETGEPCMDSSSLYYD